MDAASPEQLLPLTPAVFHILLALSDGERHGYDGGTPKRAYRGGGYILVAEEAACPKPPERKPFMSNPS
jgi:hypothetical protein